MTYTHDPNGFYQKYQSYKWVEGEQVPVEGPTFLLRPYDPHARQALLAYAKAYDPTFREKLSWDLQHMVLAYSHSYDHPEWLAQCPIFGVRGILRGWTRAQDWSWESQDFVYATKKGLDETIYRILFSPQSLSAGTKFAPNMFSHNSVETVAKMIRVHMAEVDDTEDDREL